MSANQATQTKGVTWPNTKVGINHTNASTSSAVVTGTGDTYATNRYNRGYKYGYGDPTKFVYTIPQHVGLPPETKGGKRKQSRKHKKSTRKHKKASRKH